MQQYGTGTFKYFFWSDYDKILSMIEKEANWRLFAQVAEGELGQEEDEGAMFPRKTARLVVASPLDRIRDLR